MKNAKQPDLPIPPGPLDTAGRRLWDRLHATFIIDDAHALALLYRACVQEDRGEQYRVDITTRGIVVADRFGQFRENESCRGERSASNSLRLLLRELGLDRSDVDANRLPRIAGARG